MMMVLFSSPSIKDGWQLDAIQTLQVKYLLTIFYICLPFRSEAFIMFQIVINHL